MRIWENGFEYVLVGDYYFPVIGVPEAADQRPLGMWGRMYKEHLREHRQILFNELLLTGKLDEHVRMVDRQAQERYEVLVRQMKEAEGVTEGLKEMDVMEWVRRMNGIDARAREGVVEMLYE